MPELRPSKRELIDGVGEVATVYRWNITIDSAPAGLTVPDNFNLFCSSAMPPRREAGENIEIVIRGQKYQVPGIYDDSHNIELTFIENVNNSISTFLNDWQNLMWGGGADNLDGVLATEYKADLRMTRLDNSDRPIWQYQPFGCWFMENDPVGSELAGDSSEAVRPTLTLYFDYFTQGPV